MLRSQPKQMPGLFDYEDRMEKLRAKEYPLYRLDNRIEWEQFRSELEKIFKKKSKGPGGRPRHEVVMMFKILVLQRYYNLSDEQAEFQINDRLSFQQFLGLTLADKVPDEKTIWLFREELSRSGTVEKLFKRFEAHLRDKGLVGHEGKIVDASFVDVPRQRNSRDENKQIKSGKTPDSFKKNGNVERQKDVDARWTKKGEEVHYGYKNHVKADRKTKLIEDYEVTDASVHDSQVMADLVEPGDGELHADSAYRSCEIEELLKKQGVTSQIHERAYHNRPLTEAQKKSNRKKSKLRVRVEHIFGHMTNSMNDALKMRSVGLKRITADIGLTNLVYNMARYEQIQRLQLM